MKKLIFFLLPLIVLSCQSVPKDVTFFQDIDRYKEQLAQLSPENLEYTIKPGDQLVISVSSPVLNQETVAQFNLPMLAYLSAGETLVTASSSLQTYTVDQEGYINYPKLGKVKLAGFKKSEAVRHMTEQLSSFLKEPIVNLQNASFGVSVHGEVNTPGYIKAHNERLTIIEALASAEGMTIFGDRKNVLLIREKNGAIETARLDLTTSDIFFSPYYYLEQGDVVIVEPNETQKRASKYGEAENYKLSVMSLVFSALSVLSTAAIAIISLNK